MGPDDPAKAVRPTPSSVWPAVGYERLTWESPNRDFGTMVRSEMALRRGPDSSAIPADIAAPDYAPARSV